ncbi:hypothetical protein JAAARDRAFT_139515 [Jaapia argillacea MUCL 33604]|uniref:CUE domain-containing protein n=1 Tax=Jaapia argillacea MUCL 33604 TaxID=933084 RepID=A0A067PAF9_9AGAM|nr:hypothetical protein JAAARDRAFT_139515 [Jaapia argillacea MUCL 33604]
MAEVVNVLVAFAVIVFLFRWVTSTGKDTPAEQSAINALGFRPKNVTPEMVDTVHNMFPDIPRDNIRYELLKTGSVEQATNKILERGFLDAPPAAYYTLYPRTNQAPPTPATAAAPVPKPLEKPKENLISKYKLETRLDDPSIPSAQEIEQGGKAVWEDTPEKREASLRERKAQMILAARRYVGLIVTRTPSLLLFTDKRWCIGGCKRSRKLG